MKKSKFFIIVTLLTISACSTSKLPQRKIANKPPVIYEFLSDIEGDYERFENFVHKSDVLSFNNGRINIKKGTKFVFIGDPVDRGIGSMRIVDFLNQLKADYPEQYIQIAGNRDLNKMRLPNELSDNSMKMAPRRSGIPDQEGRWKVYTEWLVQRKDNKVNRLKYILEKSMGAAKAFEYRREEISIINKMNIANITDEDVLNSFLSDFEESGRMKNYIQNSQMLYLTEDGSLVAHGVVNKENFGKIPFNNTQSKININSFDDLQEWVNKVNKKTNELVQFWIDELDHKALSYDSPWMDLVRYQEPIPNTPANSESFIYGRFSDSNGNPQLPDKKFLNNAKKAGVKRVIVGHTPAGDYPVIIKDITTNIEIVLTDTSYSKDHIPLITLNKEVNGALAIEGYSKKFGDIITKNDPYIGLKTFKDFQVIGRKKNTNEYIIHKIGTVDDRPFTSSYQAISFANLITDIKHPNCSILFYAR